MIELGGKIYFPNIHYPWNTQRSLEWNIKRAYMYIFTLTSKNQCDFDPAAPENTEIIVRLNKWMDRGGVGSGGA